ncbi:MAG: DUF4105 domain-containing protein [Deltaproteobacteria bacterium]|nr:DUF4105 domain-containing protein [Deltaproteobacteria bacterium]
MRRAVLTAVLLGLISAAAAPAAHAAPHVDLVTFGPGDLIFTRFGHGALCVAPSDDASDDDITCYNYGVTNFNQPNLVMKFLRGGVKFWVDTDSMTETLDHYNLQDRTIYRQRLLLGEAATAQIIARLEHDIRPENREYLYDHFRDNCTTRLRDIIDDALGGALHAAVAGRHFDQTYREITYDGVSDMVGLLVAGDFLMGGVSDRYPTLWEALFLPQVMRAELSALRLGGQPVVGPTEILATRVGPEPSPGSPAAGHATLFMIAGLLAPLMFWACRRHGRARRIALGVAGGLLGLLAVAIDVIVGIAVTKELAANLLILVLLPTDLMLPVLAVLARDPAGRAARALRSYLTVRAAFLTLVMVATLVGLLHQQMATVVALVVALLVVPLVSIALEPAALRVPARARAESVPAEPTV